MKLYKKVRNEGHETKDSVYSVMDLKNQLNHKGLFIPSILTIMLPFASRSHVPLLSMIPFTPSMAANVEGS